jgi:hypothetical protein
MSTSSQYFLIIFLKFIQAINNCDMHKLMALFNRFRKQNEIKLAHITNVYFVLFFVFLVLKRINIGKALYSTKDFGETPNSSLKHRVK